MECIPTESKDSYFPVPADSSSSPSFRFTFCKWRRWLIVPSAADRFGNCITKVTKLFSVPGCERRARLFVELESFHCSRFSLLLFRIYIYIHIYTFPQLSIIFINPKSNLFLSNFPFENNIPLSFEGLEKKLYSKILVQTRDLSFYLTLSNRVIIEITH